MDTKKFNQSKACEKLNQSKKIKSGFLRYKHSQMDEKARKGTPIFENNQIER